MYKAKIDTVLLYFTIKSGDPLTKAFWPSPIVSCDYLEDVGQYKDAIKIGIPATVGFLAGFVPLLDALDGGVGMFDS